MEINVQKVGGYYRIGDPLFDFWEYQLSIGMDPDLNLCEDERIRARDQRTRIEAADRFERTGKMTYISPEIQELLDKQREDGSVPLMVKPIGFVVAQDAFRKAVPVAVKLE